MIIICSVISTIKCKTKPRSPTAIHSLLVARPRTTLTNPSSPSSYPSWQPGRQSHSAAMPAIMTSNDSTPSKVVKANNPFRRRRHNGSVGALADKSHLLLNKYTHTLNRRLRERIRSQGRAAASGLTIRRCTHPWWAASFGDLEGT